MYLYILLHCFQRTFNVIECFFLLLVRERTVKSVSSQADTVIHGLF